MIKRIVSFSANNKFFMILLVAAAVGYAVYTIKHISLDAIPDLSDTQVIIYTKWDRSPQIIEDQITYPIVTSLLGAPKVKAIRGISDYGFSYIYVLFEDGTDIYWARSRVLEYLSKIQGGLPEGANVEIGPDATGVGWVFQYALVDKTGRYDLSEMRTLQDWYIKYALQSVVGVSEVATIGGFEKQYQVTIKPSRLQIYNVSIKDVVNAIKKSSNEVSGRLIEWSGKEFMVTAEGYIQDIEALKKIVVKSVNGTPVFLDDIATVTIGPQIRRGLAELNGEGEVVGGIVVMRYKENALNVIERVKKKIEEIKPGLPKGVEIVTTYDRSDLIKESINTLKHTLIEEIIVVSLIILLFLWHIPSALIPIFTIPISVLLAFIPMYMMNITSNIMSLSGIAISIGVLVDGAIVVVENLYKKVESWKASGKKGDPHKIKLEAMIEVAPSMFFSLLVIAVSFLPVFTLVDQEGKLFTPLAWMKTFTMVLASILAITLTPSVVMLFKRVDPFNFKPKFIANFATNIFVGKYYPEEKHPISKVLFKIYEPVCRFLLKHPKKIVVLTVIILVATIPLYFELGSEFMPPLNEGTILYMPTTLPGVSISESKKLLTLQDKILKSFPEVESVFGKAGRANTSTDPAPLSMMETTVVLKPKSEWREKERWYTDWAPEALKKILRTMWSDKISYDELIAEMDRALQIPGNTNAWTMPIKGRIDMLTTGMRTPIGIKIMGSDLNQIEKIGIYIEQLLKEIKGTRSVFAERVGGGYYVNFTPKRKALARYGLTLEDLQDVISTAIGGENIITTVEGRERYSINVRYARDFRTSIDNLERIFVTTMKGIQVPLGELADLNLSLGPSMIRNENGMIAGYVYVDIQNNVDIGSYIEHAKEKLNENLSLPQGYSISFSGQYENMLRVKERLKLIIPITILLILFILYLSTRSAIKSLIVLLAVPFSIVGAILLLYFLDYNISIAVWVGMIALMGLDAETGVFMLLYLDLSYEEAKRKKGLNNLVELKNAIVNGAARRVRPKTMTVLTSLIGLLPIMWSTGTGADMMKRIAAPMVGGLTTSFLMELMVYPVLYLLWRKRDLKKDNMQQST
ncbi:MAG: CusA/CzcA family heavy metal efflux RND transporter [Deferribacterota bacterium]|nr:CusA/CzcA family heavy metal efflux RND transporter [Deferribacterota bacterium]